MTDDELRKHFDLRKGEAWRKDMFISLYFWLLLFEVSWSSDTWASLQGERLKTYLFSFHSITDIDKLKAYTLIAWRFRIIWIMKSRNEMKEVKP